MNGQFFKSFIQLIIFLPLIIILIYLLGRLASKFNVTSPSRCMKVIEKLPLSKEASILIVEIGKKTYLVSATSNNIELLREIDKSEIEECKLQYNEDLKKYANIFNIKGFKNKDK